MKITLETIRTKTFVGTNGDGRIMVTNVKALNEEEIEYIKNNKKEILSTLSNERTETKKSEKQARSDMARYKNREINFDNNNGHE